MVGCVLLDFCSWRIFSRVVFVNPKRIEFGIWYLKSGIWYLLSSAASGLIESIGSSDSPADDRVRTSGTVISLHLIDSSAWENLIDYGFLLTDEESAGRSR